MIHKVPDDGVLGQMNTRCPLCGEWTEVIFSTMNCLFPVTDYDDEKPMRYHNCFRTIFCKHCGSAFRVGIKVPQNLPEWELEWLKKED